MGRISDHGLIEVTDLDVSMAFGICDRAEVAYVAVATDPHCWAAWQRFNVGCLEPFIKLTSVTPDVCMRRPRHLKALARKQDSLPTIYTRILARFHLY
jgi:hypothetical protein